MNGYIMYEYCTVYARGVPSIRARGSAPKALDGGGGGEGTGDTAIGVPDCLLMLLHFIFISLNVNRSMKSNFC